MKRRLPLTPLARKSLADVTRRKGRTLLVVLGIVIGIFGLTAINVAADALGGAFAYSAGKTPTPDLVFGVETATPEVTSSALAALQSADNVQAVQLMRFFSTRWKVAAVPGHVSITIVAYPDLQHIALSPFQLTGGTYPGAGELLMETSNRALQDFAIGDTVTLETPNGPTPVRVAGTTRTLRRTSAGFSNNARAYMTPEALQQLAGSATATQVWVQVHDKAQEKATLKSLAQLLRTSGITVASANTLDDAWDPGPINGLFTIMRVLSAIALVLTGFLIINTITTLVAEQIKIIGTMKAVGGTGRVVRRSYLTSIAVYAVLGTALGLALGILGGELFASYLASIITLDLGPFSILPGIFITSLIVGLGVPFAAALFPLWAGTRVTVREAMAAYGVDAGTGRVRLGRSRRLSWVPQTTWLGLRGIFRRRGRAILTLLALTFSATTFLAIQTTTYSANQFIGQIFSQYGFDAYVGTKALPYDQIQAKLLAIPNVTKVERFEQDEVKTQWGQVILTAFDPETTLYHYQVLDGRWLTTADTNALLISDALAQQSGLRTGDHLTFSSSISDATWTIIGEVHDENGGLGIVGTAFTTVANLHAFANVPADLSSSFMLQAADRSPAAIDTMATTIDDTLSSQGLSPFVSTAQQQIKRNQNQFQILYVLLYAVAAIVALVGVLGLFNTLTTSVLERRREIGILRSMGATGWRVAGVFWTEGMALAGISWLVALALGIPAAYGFVALISAVLVRIPFAFNPLTLVATLAFTLVIATLASILPAMGASRVRIADTLRYE